jgi:hypothetical protein
MPHAPNGSNRRKIRRHRWERNIRKSLKGCGLNSVGSGRRLLPRSCDNVNEFQCSIRGDEEIPCAAELLLVS